MDAIQKQAEQAGSDQARWVGTAAAGQRPTFNKPVPELTITPELRQQGYQEEINFRLQDYIDRIIVAIMETNPSILEVK